MKKCILICLLLFFTMTFTVALASNEKEGSNPNYRDHSRSVEPFIITFKLPVSVKVIEDEAFEGTAIMNVELPERLTNIGDRAFANIKTLRYIYIPMATETIAKTAFDGNYHVMITAAPNSYARTWAKENKLPFSPLTVMYAGTGTQSVTGSLSSTSKEVLDTEASETQESNRIWRKLEEIQEDDTIEIIANVIQGRAPPMV